MEGDRREVSLSLKCPVIMSQASLVKQISENVPSVPEFLIELKENPISLFEDCRKIEEYFQDKDGNIAKAILTGSPYPELILSSGQRPAVQMEDQNSALHSGNLSTLPA